LNPQDWPSHKLDCYVKPPNGDKSGSDVVRSEFTGILFPEDEAVPKMIMVKTLMGWHDKGLWQTQNLRPYIPDDERKGRAHIHFGHQFSMVRGVMTSGPAIQIFFRKNFQEDGSKLNRCIQHITAGKVARPWAGPFIAFRSTGADTIWNAELEEDLPILIEYFSSLQATQRT
jgi:hypothetical protein